MQKTILIIQVVISILLTVLILMQNKEGGLGAVFGGGESFQAVRRGPEKFIFISTIILSAAFMVNALLYTLF
jgi:protein translocase SecG subunit